MKKNLSDIKLFCKHKKVKYEQYRISPLDIKLKKYLKIFEYFLYYAPNVAFKKVKINEAKWENTYDEFINKDESMTQYSVIYAKDKKNVDYYSNLGLDGKNICFECNRMVLKKGKGENKLTTLLRHIRNVIAHGNLYYNKKGKVDIFFLEDLYEGTITARMVITGDHLVSLKKIIEKNIK